MSVVHTSFLQIHMGQKKKISPGHVYRLISVTSPPERILLLSTNLSPSLNILKINNYSLLEKKRLFIYLRKI